MSKQLINKTLDLLVGMSEHCLARSFNDLCKCSDCELLNNDKFLSDLESVCVYHNIDYQDRLDKVSSILID